MHINNSKLKWVFYFRCNSDNPFSSCSFKQLSNRVLSICVGKSLTKVLTHTAFHTHPLSLVLGIELSVSHMLESSTAELHSQLWEWKIQNKHKSQVWWPDIHIVFYHISVGHCSSGIYILLGLSTEINRLCQLLYLLELIIYSRHHFPTKYIQKTWQIRQSFTSFFTGNLPRAFNVQMHFIIPGTRFSLKAQD